MLLVNNPGTWSAIYAPLEHAEWNGCTPTDLIFPFFLYIMGAAIPFSFGNRMETGEDRSSIYHQIARRTVILFSLGIFLNVLSVVMSQHTLNPVEIWTNLRIPGVLQRIGLCYLFASLLVLNYSTRVQSALSLMFVLAYGIAMTTIPIPMEINGELVYSSGVLEKGINLSAFIDSILLKGHMWKTTLTWDPEGVLSTLPSIATTLFGALTGAWLRQPISETGKVKSMLIVAGCGTLAGLLMQFWVPLNKSIWSSSYTVFTASLALFCIAFFYWLIDIKGYRKFTGFFLVYGSNAITVFVLSGIFARFLDFIKLPQPPESNFITLKTILFKTLFLSWLPEKVASLAYAVSFVILWYCIMYIFYKRKIFLKI